MFPSSCSDAEVLLGVIFDGEQLHRKTDLYVLLVDDDGIEMFTPLDSCRGVYFPYPVPLSELHQRCTQDAYS